MPRSPTVHLRIYPDDCDAYGHVNQAAFLRLLERARWEALAGGPGTDVFTRAGAWPAIRTATVQYHSPAFPGDVLAFELALAHLGRTSMSLLQSVRRQVDRSLVASAQFVAVCIDAEGRPVAVPPAVREFFGARPTIPAEGSVELIVDKAVISAELRGDGEAILFIHGFPFDRTMWRPQMESLRGWMRAAPDLAGFGFSDLPAGERRILHYADEMAAFLKRVGVDRAVVCGLSMGGYVALEMWRRHPQSVRALVLASTRASADSPEGRAARDVMISRVRERGSAALVEGLLPRLLAPATTSAQPETVAHVRAMMEDTGPDAAIAALAAMRDRADSTDLLSTIRVPVLVIGGAADTLIPADAQEQMAGAIPGAALEIIPAAGHLAPLEQPRAFSDLLAHFLGSLH